MVIRKFLSAPPSIARCSTGPGRVGACQNEDLSKRGAVEFDVVKAWAPWIILGDGVGILLAGHVNRRILTMIFSVGVFLMSLNFLLPKLAAR